MLRRNPVDQHVRLWRDDRRIDKAKEEKSTDKRANRYVGGLRVFPLPFPLRKNSQIKEETVNALVSDYEFVCISSGSHRERHLNCQ